MNKFDQLYEKLLPEAKAEMEVGGDYEYQKEMSEDLSNEYLTVRAFIGKDIKLLADKDDLFDLVIVTHTMKGSDEWILEVALEGQGKPLAMLKFPNKKALIKKLKEEGVKLDYKVF